MDVKEMDVRMECFGVETTTLRPRHPDMCAYMWRRGHHVPPREEAGAGVVERPFPPQRIHNFPLRGRGTSGLRQGHNAEAHRSDVCAGPTNVHA